MAGRLVQAFSGVEFCGRVTTNRRSSDEGETQASGEPQHRGDDDRLAPREEAELIEEAPREDRITRTILR